MRPHAATLGLLVYLSGCTAPEQQISSRARSHLSRADFAECELVTRMRPNRPGEGLLEQLGGQSYTNKLCLRTKLYRMGYSD